MVSSRVQKHVKGKRSPKNRLIARKQQTTSSPKRPRQISTSLPLTSDCQAIKAMPISPPQSAGVRGLYRCIVDYNHQPFSITWSASRTLKFPWYTKIPKQLQYGETRNYLIMVLTHQYDSPEKESFPILKLAHADEVSMKLIQYEFGILAKLKEQGLPVVEFDQQPILDNGVTCGYRMEKLVKINAIELRSRTDDIKQVIDQFHHRGFSHGDVGPSNIMTKDGRITLIDPSFAGALGNAVPSFFPSWVYTDGKFGIGSDLERFSRFIVPK